MNRYRAVPEGMASLTPQQIARAFGLEYRHLPDEITTQGMEDLLPGVRRNSVYQAIRMGTLPRRVVEVDSKNKIVVVPKDDALLWAYYKRPGRPSAPQKPPTEKRPVGRPRRVYVPVE